MINWEEVVGTYLEEPSQYFLGVIDKNHEEPQPQHPFSKYIMNCVPPEWET
jgi:hypothetical protein